ncbi:MAG: hypothetical protein AAFY06_09660 [Pseudomonadota bacterium]
MNSAHHERGGASVAVLNSLDGWEANLVMNLRLWCEGPNGRIQVWNDYACSFPKGEAKSEMHAFEALLTALVECASRPLVRHSVHCSCVGSDECVFVNLVKTAADGHLNDAALIATLLTRPSKAEMIAMLAGQVGTGARQIYTHAQRAPTGVGASVVRLH